MQSRNKENVNKNKSYSDISYTPTYQNLLQVSRKTYKKEF